MTSSTPAPAAGEPPPEGTDQAGGTDDVVAVVVVRDGRLPGGAAAAVAEAGGAAIVIGSGAEAGARALPDARLVRWAETGPGLRPARLATVLADVVGPVPLVLLPATPDGRDLAPRLAASLARPLVAGALEARCDRPDRRGAGGPAADAGVTVRANVARLDDRVLVPVEVAGPAVVTLLPAPDPERTGAPDRPAPSIEPLPVAGTGPFARAVGPDPEILAVLEPDLRTMDLAEANRVMAGGAGLAAGVDDDRARAHFERLEQVATALGASAGATRVATDAGWAPPERQIGTTGVTIDPDLYLAFGISGATQHVGGLGSPHHVISVNVDPACPMTALADLGLITDASALVDELARRLGVATTGAGGPARAAVGDG